MGDGVPPRGEIVSTDEGKEVARSVSELTYYRVRLVEITHSLDLFPYNSQRERERERKKRNYNVIFNITIRR